jgi:hypothetical protein
MRGIKLKLPLMPSDIEDTYVDQAVDQSAYVFAAYTSYGIKQIDSDFCKRIQELNEDPEVLKEETITNKHLHACIKENLLENLETATKNNKGAYYERK